MSNNFYLRTHVYRGEESDLEPGGSEWFAAFHEFAANSPIRRAVDCDSPFIHVCHTSGNVTWAMVPHHVEALARAFPLTDVFVDEYDRKWTGEGFLKFLEGREDDYRLKVGEYFG